MLELRPVTEPGAPGYTVMVFPVDRAHWVYPSRWMRPSRPGTDGEFRIRAMPAGDYFMALLTDVDEADLGDAGFLEELSLASVRVTLIEGKAVRQDVKIR